MSSGKTFTADKGIPDLSGKVIVVTGGNTGLGKETVRQLAKHNPATIYVAARTRSKVEDAIREIKTETPSARLEFLELDLTDFDSISRTAKDFISRSPRLDILINNAGIMNVDFSLTKQGYEIQFGTNHMGHALLTKLLLPSLLHTATLPTSDVRIINLSSQGHTFAGLSRGLMLDPDRAKRAFSSTRYGTSKLANLLHARALRTRYPQLTCTSLHPGVINTQLFDSTMQGYGKIPLVGWYVAKVMDFAIGKDVSGGSLNTLWCATADKDEVRKGYYFMPVGILAQGYFYTGEQEADRLWEWTEAELAKHGYP